MHCFSYIFFWCLFHELPKVSSRILWTPTCARGCGRTAGTSPCPRAGGVCPSSSCRGRWGPRPGSHEGAAAADAGKTDPSPHGQAVPSRPGDPPAAVPSWDSPERDAVGTAWPAAGSSPGEPNPTAICPPSLAVPSSLLACSALMGCDVIPAVVPPLQPGMDACCAGERADPLSRHSSRAPLKTGT